MSNNKDYLNELPSFSPNKWYTVSFFSKTHVKSSINNTNETLSYCVKDNTNQKLEEYTENYTFQKDLLALRIGTGRETYEEAVEDAKRIREADPYHHVYVAEGGKWCPFIFTEEDNDKYVTQSEYDNEQLNDMMKKYKDNQDKAQILHEMRKNELMINGVNDNIQSRTKTREELLVKLKETNNKEDRKTLKEKLSIIDEQIEKMEQKAKEVNQRQAEISDILKMGKLDSMV
jgi:hypothetical protein